MAWPRRRRKAPEQMPVRSSNVVTHYPSASSLDTVFPTYGGSVTPDQTPTAGDCTPSSSSYDGGSSYSDSGSYSDGGSSGGDCG